MANDMPSIFKDINKLDFLPDDCFRRNSVYYNLVTYINHIIALYISNSYVVIPVFINRADKEITDLSNRLDHHIYFDKCRMLLLQVSNQINSIIDPVIAEILPLIYKGDRERFSKCPEKFCFHWVEAGVIRLPYQFPNLEEALKFTGKAKPSNTSYCGCSFGVCNRLVKEQGNKDWYEPNEPLLELNKVSNNHFVDL